MTLGPLTKDTSPVSCGPRQQLWQPDQIERSAREDQQPVDLFQAAQFDLPSPGDRFEPTKCRFDPRPGMLTHRVARMPRGAAINRAAARSVEILRDVWRATQFARDVDEFPHVMPYPRRPCGAATARVSIAHAASINNPASRSARPSACVAIASTIKPWRFSISRWPRYANRDSAPFDFRYSFASGSVVDACVSFFRCWPRKLLPSPSRLPSFR